MKPIYLHIGSTKTGTSSLQQYFTHRSGDLARHGVVYPVAGRRASGQIAHHNLCYEHQQGRIKSGVFKPDVGIWAEALAEIDRTPATAGIISSEAFMNCRPQQVPHFRDALAGRDVHLIAYVRRQDLWMQSAWNQQARFGRCSLDVHEFAEGIAKRSRGDYHLMLEPWAAAFGRDRLFVRNFDTLPAGGIVPDFFDTFLPDVPVVQSETDDARRNTKAGIKQLVAVAMVLDICRERIGPDFQLPSSSAIRIAGYFRDRPDEITSFSILSYEDACEIHHRFAPSNERLAALSPSFGASGGFPPPQPKEFRNHVDMTRLGPEVLTDDEHRFVIRMAREVSRATEKTRRAPRRRFWR